MHTSEHITKTSTPLVTETRATDTEDLAYLGDLAINGGSVEERTKARQTLLNMAAEKINSRVPEAALREVKVDGVPDIQTSQLANRVRSQLIAELPFTVNEGQGVDESLVLGIAQYLSPHTTPTKYDSVLFNDAGQVHRHSLLGNIASNQHVGINPHELEFGVGSNAARSYSFDEEMTATLARYAGNLEYNAPRDAKSLGLIPSLLSLRLNPDTLLNGEQLSPEIPKAHTPGESPVFAQAPGGRLESLGINVSQQMANKMLTVISEFQDHMEASNSKLSQIVTLLPTTEGNLTFKRSTAINGYVQMSGNFSPTGNSSWLHKDTGLVFTSNAMSWEVRDAIPSQRIAAPTRRAWLNSTV